MGHCAVCDEAFRIFACLWGQTQLLRLCTLLCRNRYTLAEWLSTAGPWASTMLLSCVVCIVVPDEATIVAAVCSSLASTWALLPHDMDNGGIYELLVHVNLFAGLGWSLLSGRPACEGWEASGPAVRCLLALVFMFAALARLNSDYHDVRRSSSTVLLLHMANMLGTRFGMTDRSVDALGDRAITFLLRVGLFGLEAIGMLVPLLLWCGRVGHGLTLAWTLGLALAQTMAFDFSCLLVASMPLWVPQPKVLKLRWMTITPAARGCSLLMAVALLTLALLQRSSRTWQRLRLCALLMLIAANPLQYLLPDSAGPPPMADCSEPSRGATHPVVQQVARITIVLALLNGACPYLGLKTQSTWSMFSNLRVEGGVTNHFFIPASLQLFGYTRECVTVTKTDVAAVHGHHTVMGGPDELSLFRGYIERTGIHAGVHANTSFNGDHDAADGDVMLPYMVPFFQLRRLISVQALPFLQEFFVEYVHCGAPHRFEVRRGLPTRASDPRLAKVPPLLLQKFLAFRSVPAGDHGGTCAH